MIRIIDKLTGKDYDLPKGIKISIDRKNPLIDTEKGSISLPVIFPYTDVNLDIIGNPQRFDRLYKLNIKRNVVIITNLCQFESVLTITQCQKPIGISGTFLLYESIFYNKMKDVTLSTVFENHIRDEFTGTRDEKVAQWATYLNNVMIDDDFDDELAVFPVCTKFTKSSTGINSPFLGNGSYDFLNHLAVNSDHWVAIWGNIIENGVSSTYYKLSNIIARTATIEEKTIQLPVGYSITPFLKLNYILKEIFSFFNFNLNPSKFTTDSEFKKITVLNNTIDAILTGKLMYRQLVPTCTVNEFLDALRIDFGCEFILSENNVDVDVVFWNDVIDNDITENFDKLISADPICDFESSKQLKLVRETGELLSASNFESYQQFEKENNPIIEIQHAPTVEEYDANPEYWFGTFFDRQKLQYIKRYKTKNSFNVEIIKQDIIGINQYNYFESNQDTQYVERSSKSSLVQMIPVSLSSRWQESVNTNIYTMIPYIGNYRQLNSYIEYDGEKQQLSEANCPIMFCFRKGKQLPNPLPDPVEEGEWNGYFGDSRLFWGSTYKYNNLGLSDGSFNLVFSGENGLYDTFWKKFDQILKDSYQPITLPLNMTSIQVVKFNMCKQKILFGQPLLPESLKYEITDDGINVIEAKFRTTKLYV